MSQTSPTNSWLGGRWTEAYGDYVNGEPGQPLLVSLLLYLDDAWPLDWAAETLFLDSQVLLWSIHFLCCMISEQKMTANEAGGVPKLRYIYTCLWCTCLIRSVERHVYQHHG